MRTITLDEMGKSDLEDLYWFLTEAKDDNYNLNNKTRYLKDQINSQYKDMNFHDLCTVVFRGHEGLMLVEAAHLSIKHRGFNGRAGMAVKILKSVGEYRESKQSINL